MECNIISKNYDAKETYWGVRKFNFSLKDNTGTVVRKHWYGLRWKSIYIVSDVLCGSYMFELSSVSVHNVPSIGLLRKLYEDHYNISSSRATAATVVVAVVVVVVAVVVDLVEKMLRRKAQWHGMGHIALERWQMHVKF
jgi:cobalamin biosynthesis protein CbiD